ncbi:MAG: hypothetical protein P8R03_01590 [Candidatus Poseidoniaceae archaeon]|nr:hypothetical protein [Candidatus Poseidoniaceae archaeon]
MSKFSSFKSSSAGSYLGFYALSAITTAMFICVFLFHVFSNSPFRVALETDYLTFIYIVIAWVGLGWLMCLIAGIGFDILPLIHGSKPFHENAMRQFLIINFAGQSVLCIATFMQTTEKIVEFSTVGISFLCLSVLLLGGPGRRLSKESMVPSKDDEVGYASLIPGLIFPFFGSFVLGCWLYRETAGILELGRSLMIMFFLLITLIMIVSHFNRRLNWQVINPEKMGIRFGLFFALALTHILFAFLAGKENSADITLIVQMQNLTLGLAMIWVFIMCNPVKITRMAFTNGGMAHSRPIFAALWMLPFSSFHAINAAAYTSRPGMPGYATFLCTSALLCIWGYAWYLHEDHLHINIHKRKVNWLFIMSFFTAFVAIQLLFLENARGDLDNQTEQLIWIVSSLFGTVVIAFNFVRMTLLTLQPWQRIPMFYGRYLQDQSSN